MRRLVAALAVAGLLGSLGPLADAMHGVQPVLVVDDGAFFYDLDGDCVGDTNDPDGAQALRQWELGLPLLGAEWEQGGTGCAGGPRTWQVSILPDHHGLFLGTITYGRDANAGFGALNDFHIHVYDTFGVLITSTLTAYGPGPVTSLDGTGYGTHPVEMTIESGTYLLVEDVASGQHTTWRSNFVLYEA